MNIFGFNIVSFKNRAMLVVTVFVAIMGKKGSR
jgi:hypothetical protein